MDNFVTVLLQIHSCICAPKIMKIERDLTKVIEKIKRVQFFLPHSVECNAVERSYKLISRHDLDFV